MASSSSAPSKKLVSVARAPSWISYFVAWEQAAQETVKFGKVTVWLPTVVLSVVTSHVIVLDAAEKLFSRM